MRRPRSRRALLASVASLSLGIAGCSEGNLAGSDEPLDSGVVSADEFDCTDVERPEPEAPDREGALEPAPYPDPPDSLEAADEYVREFEEAYRRNAFIEDYGSEAAGFDFEFDTRQTDEVESDAEREAVLVSVVYHLTTETRQTAPTSEQYIRVTYYVDENIALRARYSGIAEGPAFDPDPRDAGEPVACFE